MSRYDLLPPNATQLERDISRAVSSLQRVGPPVPIIRTAKRTNIPDSVVPWLIYEYGLGEILPYLGNNQRLALRDGILWQRIRGTPESVRVALSWIGIEGLIEEPEGGTDRWAEYMLGLAAATEGDEIIDRIAAVARISSPVRSRLQRIYAVHDFRRAVWDDFSWDDGSIYDDHSGVRPRPDWPQISYGRRYSARAVWDGPPPPPAPRQLIGHARLIDAWQWDEDAWDEGWHVPNPQASTTTKRGSSAQYVGQNWAPFKWQRKPWGDINVIASSPVPPFWNETQLLLPMDGPNNSTVFTDLSKYNRTVQVVGDAKILTNLGEPAGYFDGDNDYLDVSIPVIGTGDFTIEMFIRPSNVNFADRMLAYIGDFSSNNAINQEIGSFFQLERRIYWYEAAGTAPTIFDVVQANTWQHIAVCRANGTIRVFYNGTPSAGRPSSTNWNSGRIRIGAKWSNPPNDGKSYIGYKKQYRVTLAARYTEPFTPPASLAPFS